MKINEQTAILIGQLCKNGEIEMATAILDYYTAFISLRNVTNVLEEKVKLDKQYLDRISDIDANN